MKLSMSSQTSASRNPKVATTKTSTVTDAKAAMQSTDTAIVQCWTPSFARCHYDENNDLVEVTCRCKTCCSKSVGGKDGNGFSFGTVEYWLNGHELNAWKDPLGSGFYVVAIKSCTEKFIEKIHPEEFAKGVRFWMNFKKGCFEIRQPREEKTQSGASAAAEKEQAPSQPTKETAPAPRPFHKPPPAVNPWGKDTAAATPKDSETARLMSAPIPKEKKPKVQKGGKWKQVDTKLAPDSRHVVLDLASAVPAGPAGPRIAPFDLRLETLCQFGDKCRNKTHTAESKFVCPYNHHTTATIIAKGEPIPDSHCSYDKVTFVDGKVKVDKCKNKACTKDHLEHHVAYCKSTGASNAAAPVQVVYVLPNGQMMPGQMMQHQMPPQMPQFAPPRFHGKAPNKAPRLRTPPNRPLPVPKTQEVIPEDAELEHVAATTAIDENTESEQEESEQETDEEIEGEDDVLARFAANVGVSQ